MQSRNLNNLEPTSLQKEIIDLVNKEYRTAEVEEKLSLKRRFIIREYYKLLANSKKLLTKEEYQLILAEYLANCCFKEFSEGRIAIISDTHLASKHENVEYLNQVKEFLKENNIKYLLHGGDIGDGMVAYSKEYSTYIKQLEHILDVYDFEGTIKNYVLGGNHDDKYRRKNKDYDILKLLEEKNTNIEAVGYYQAYFKLGSNVVSFEHKSNYKSFIARNFSILGHAHCLTYKESTVVLPTLSDSFPDPKKLQRPGFIILDNAIKNNYENLEFTEYNTTPNGIEKGKTKKYSLSR